MVIINPEAFPITNVKLNGINQASATSYTSSETLTMSKKNLSLASDKSVTFDAPANSVTTIILSN